MVTHSGILAWRISWTEEPGGLQSLGSERVGHDKQLSTHTQNGCNFFETISLLRDSSAGSGFWLMSSTAKDSLVR